MNKKNIIVILGIIIVISSTIYFFLIIKENLLNVTSSEIAQQSVSTSTIQQSAQSNIHPDSAKEIALWKTYKSDEYGYEIKYPPEWNLVEEPYLGNIDVILKNKKIDDRDIALEILIRSSKKADLEENVNYWRDKGLTSVEEFNLGDLSGKKIFISQDSVVNDGFGSGAHNVQNDTIVYLFRIQEEPILFQYIITGINKAEDSEIIRIFDRILSTFKLTN